MSRELLSRLERRALEGVAATVDEAVMLDHSCDTDSLCDAADRIRRRRCGDRIDTCSIVNARSGRCSEDCKWCAQSRFYSTGVDEYSIVADEDMLGIVEGARRHGVGRVSLVTSGRRVAGHALDELCRLYRLAADAAPGMTLCASMGLIGKEELTRLKEAGVSRYHCNLETSSGYFPSLCSTHSHRDKLATIRAAREAGMEVCSGGIIGMGETMRQRLEMAAEAVEAGAVSIPMNILNPIPGTPLADVEPIAEEEVVRTAALMRFVAPDTVIRFAGGRARISVAATERMLRGGVNGAMIGDLLTTVGNNASTDMEMFSRLGFTR